MLKAVEWKQKKLLIIDQTKLPGKVMKVQIRNVTQVLDAISQQKVRGGGLLGCFVAFGIYLAVKQPPFAKTYDKLLKEVEKVKTQIMKLEPTCMDVEWALIKMHRCVLNNRDHKLNTLRDIMLKEAVGILKECESASNTIIKNGQELVRDGDSVLIYGPTGSLANLNQGNSLGIISLASKDKEISVIVPESRPGLEGSKLTALELKQAKIPYHLVADNAVAHLMSTGKINIVILNADRIAMNGDVAAKIGSYAIALLAYQHRIPVYISAPVSVFDRTLMSGEPITIKEKKGVELLNWNNKPVTIPGAKALCPITDITPFKCISALITDLGIVRAPYDQNLSNLFSTLG